MTFFLQWIKKVQSTSIRNKVLGAVSALILLSLLSTLLSLVKLTEVKNSIESIHQWSVPLEKNLAKLKSDADLLKKDLDFGLGFENWKNPQWKPRPLSRWLVDTMELTLSDTEKLLQRQEGKLNASQKVLWNEWLLRIKGFLLQIQTQSEELYLKLSQQDLRAASILYPEWVYQKEHFMKELEWGNLESERALKSKYYGVHAFVSDLKGSLQGILVAVIILSLLLIWIGERALRPLSELTRIVKGISERGGVQKEDRLQLPEVILSRKDEVSELILEFKNMATHLLEREKTVETQKQNLQEQNQLLSEMSVLNETIFNSIRSVLIVTDFNAHITQYNTEAARLFAKNTDELIGKNFFEIFSGVKLLDQCPEKEEWKNFFENLNESKRIIPFVWGKKTMGGVFLPLKHISSHKLIRSLGKWWNPEVLEAQSVGAIFILEDLTEQVELTHRLNLAEKLAAVGQMSAQVAHEIRNPLHSIGLEAELALENSGKLNLNTDLKHSLQSILMGVDRLEKITENYLRLSRLSQGRKTKVDLGELLEKVLATYSTLFEKNQIDVQWQRSEKKPYYIEVDSDLMENVLGNIYKNSVEALSEKQKNQPDFFAVIYTSLGKAENSSVDASHGARSYVSLRVQDNGPGLSDQVKENLFTPFVTTKSYGTGLGLSFVKKVVEENEGSITVKSFEEPLSGVLFEIQFPLYELPKLESPRSNEGAFLV